MSNTPKTLFEKVWEQHVVVEPKGEPTLLYIDLQLCTRSLRRRRLKDCGWLGARCAGPIAPSPRSITTCPRRLRAACTSSIRSRRRRSPRCARTARTSASSSTTSNSREQGIVHVIGPELGITKPGMTIVCGDSHTSTHGAFGALAFGIGTSEVEHVLATQTLAAIEAEDLPHLGRGRTAARA